MDSDSSAPSTPIPDKPAAASAPPSWLPRVDAAIPETPPSPPAFSPEKIDSAQSAGGGAGTAAGRLADVLAKFRERRAQPRPPAAPTANPFPVATRVIAKRQRGAVEALKARDRRALRKAIRPENAAKLLEHLPEHEDDRTHALIAGDFVFCDFVEAVIARRGPPLRLTCATLSLSKDNVAALERLSATLRFPVDLLLSHYFQKTSRDIYAALLAVVGRNPLVSVRVSRSHCKVTLFDYADAALVVESSANLRSSRNLEQVSIFNDRELLSFHRAWIEEAATLSP